MTLALILVVAFLCAWFFDSAKKKGDKKTYKQKTITNVKLQDELGAKNFKKIIDDLTALDAVGKFSGNSLLVAIEGLYREYNVPDRRTPDEKAADKEAYSKALSRKREEGYYPEDDSVLPLLKKIWHHPYDAPLMDRLDLLVGSPKTVVKVENVTYEYDFRGIPTDMYRTIPAKLIGDLEVLLTTRDLDAAGYNYSWDRKESLWQQSEKKIKDYDENKKKYPWLYK